MRRIVVKALKDEARILGFVLRAGAIVELDITDDQTASVQASVDRGDVAVDGWSATKAAPSKQDDKSKK